MAKLLIDPEVPCCGGRSLLTIFSNGDPDNICKIRSVSPYKTKRKDGYKFIMDHGGELFFTKEECKILLDGGYLERMFYDPVFNKNFPAKYSIYDGWRTRNRLADRDNKSGGKRGIYR